MRILLANFAAMHKMAARLSPLPLDALELGDLPDGTVT
jgi:hypothetical protein